MYLLNSYWILKQVFNNFPNIKEHIHRRIFKKMCLFFKQQLEIKLSRKTLIFFFEQNHYILINNTFYKILFKKTWLKFLFESFGIQIHNMRILYLDLPAILNDVIRDLLSFFVIWLRLVDNHLIFLNLIRHWRFWLVKNLWYLYKFSIIKKSFVSQSRTVTTISRALNL